MPRTPGALADEEVASASPERSESPGTRSQTIKLVRIRREFRPEETPRIKGAVALRPASLVGRCSDSSKALASGPSGEAPETAPFVAKRQCRPALLLSSDAGARGWTADTSACIRTRERRPLSCGARSRAASSGGPRRTRRISAAARLTARVSGVGWVRLANHPAASGRRGSCAGPAPSISAAIRGGRSRSAPVAPDPNSVDRAETDLVAVEITIGRATGSRAWGSRWSRSRSSPRAEGSSSARAAARPGRPPAPGAAACRG
jgi:hypothetical protein